MAGLDFLYSPNSQYYEARQRMTDDGLNNQTKMLANQHSAAMNPMLQQQQGLQNQTMQAQLPGVVGTSQTLAARGSIDQQMAPMRMQAEQQELLSKASKEQLEDSARMGEKLLQIGSMLEQIQGPGQKSAALPMIAQKYGLAPDDPILKALMQQTGGDESKIAPLFIKAGTAVTQTTGKLIAERAKLATEQQGQTERNAQDNQARIESARIAAESRISVAEINAMSAQQRAVMKESLQQRVRVLGQKMAERQATEAEKTEYQSALHTLMLLNTVRADDTAPQVMQGGTPTTASQRVDSGVQRIMGNMPQQAYETQQQQPAPQQSATPHDIRASAGKAFGSYDPNAYEYRINPQTGKLQRKPKR